jgi:hypothetical protein
MCIFSRLHNILVDPFNVTIVPHLRFLVLGHIRGN